MRFFTRFCGHSQNIFDNSLKFWLFLLSPSSRGAWIEIGQPDQPADRSNVAPLVGAWIEMRFTTSVTASRWVVPLGGDVD